MAERYTCQHGGPGEVTSADKKIFVVSYSTALEQVHKELVRAQYEEILAAELSIFEELMKNPVVQGMVDPALMRLYFGLAVKELLQARQEPAKIFARMGIYIAMYLKHGGNKFFELTNASPDVQKEVLRDMYTGLGQVAFESGLVKLLKTQVPCTCLDQAFPAVKDTASTR